MKLNFAAAQGLYICRFRSRTERPRLYSLWDEAINFSFLMERERLRRAS